MKYLSGILALTGLTINLAAGQHTDTFLQTKFAKRLATSAVQGQKGAILCKDGKPTTCEVALIDNLMGLVAANCLDYTPGNTAQVTMSSNKYQVMVNGAGQTANSQAAMYPVDFVKPHFAYDPKTFANNLALIKFNPDAKLEWKNYIAAKPSDWQSKFLVLREADVSTGKHTWLPDQVAVDNTQPPMDECGQANPLFAANTQDLLCTDQVANQQQSQSSQPQPPASQQPQGSNGPHIAQDLQNASVSQNDLAVQPPLQLRDDTQQCVLPYSSVYGVHDPDLAIAALYSHSVVKGNSLCDYQEMYNYYTVIANYLEWAAQIAQETIYLYVADYKFDGNTDPNHAMNAPSGTLIPQGAVLVGGNLYDPIVVSGEPKPSSGSSTPADTPTDTPTTSATSATPSTSPSTTASSPTPSSTADSQKSDKKSISPGIIALIVGGVLIALVIIGFLLWRRRNKKKREEQQQRADLINMNHEPGMGEQDFMPDYASRPTSYNGHMHLNTKINQHGDGEKNGW